MFVLMLNDEAEAGELLRETFPQVWKEISSCDSARESLFTWTVLRARQQALARLRGRPRASAGVFAMSAGEGREDAALYLAFFGGLTIAQIGQHLDQPPENVQSLIAHELRLLRESQASAPRNAA